MKVCNCEQGEDTKIIKLDIYDTETIKQGWICHQSDRTDMAPSLRRVWTEIRMRMNLTWSLMLGEV